jgi:protein TonB
MTAAGTMVNTQKDAYHHALRRGALALGLLVAHLGLIALVAYGSTAIRKPNPIAPIVVTLLPEAPRPAQNLTLPSPVLTLPHPVPPAMLAMDVPIEATNAAVFVAANPDTPPSPAPPAAAAPRQSQSLDLPAMSNIAYLQPPAPHYPRQSRLAHEQGLVVLRVLIDESGRVRDIDIYRSSGHPRLDQEARDAVAKALFKPYRDGGVARPAVAMVPIEFSLNGASS